ncbi:Pectate lyase superfamily protein [Klenkia taihuensis]|uniref:Pectate lyase superfamily protein n=2 Tax=Klenkia taihuensis TaxID=1225127 RepID=A0A1I1NPJ0_9ACTN|nr:Pectate lyase superfamily protein [Klenkia taihuensis]
MAVVVACATLVVGLLVVVGRGTTVTPEEHGAVGDGRTDDTAALQRTLAALEEGDTLELRDGAVYPHAEVLELATSGVHLEGNGAALLATRELTSAVHISGDDVEIEDLTLQLETSTQRFHAWEQMKLRISGDGVQVRRVTVLGAAAAGVYVGNGAGDFLLEDVVVEDSRADGIHMTGGAHDGRVVSPVTRRTGDDGVAVVSYLADEAVTARIVVESPVVEGTTWGRGLSVVGGQDVTYRDIDVRDTDAAGVYIGSEGDPYFTYGSQDVLVEGGRVTGANTNSDKDHGSVLVYTGNERTGAERITVRDLQLVDSRASASWDVGVLRGPGTEIADVTLAGLTIEGGPDQAFWTNAEDAVLLTGSTADGRRLPDRGDR